MRFRLVGAAVALAALPLAAAPPAVAVAEPDYTITVDPAATGAAIDDSMYGVFFEDINFAADGGLYAELVRNRSFEFLPVDNRSYTGLTGWTPPPAGGTGTRDGRRRRPPQRAQPHLPEARPANPAAAGTASPTPATTPASRCSAGRALRLLGVGAHRRRRRHAADGHPARHRRRSARRAGRRSPSAATPGPSTPATLARHRDHRRRPARRCAAGGTGTLRLDMVSLFPRDTFKDRPTACARDLAEKVAALQPGLRPLPRRLPGQHRQHVRLRRRLELPAGPRRTSGRTPSGRSRPGPPTPTSGATTSRYGLGYYEYFQFSEDIGAMPLPVVPALVTGCGQNRATDDEALLQRHIQDTLDLIEFANGPVTSTWGRLRARDGPPEAVRADPRRGRQRGEPAGRVLRQLPAVPRRDQGEVPGRSP